MIAGLPQSEIIAIAAALWLAVALVATIVGLRRAARGNAALREARAIADLLAGGPAVPILVYPDGAIDADPRIAAWLGLDRVPRHLAELSGDHGIAAQDQAALTEAVALARTSGRAFAQTVVLPGSARVLSVMGQPYSVRGDDRRTILLWVLDSSEQQRAIFQLTDQADRLASALDRLSALIEAAPFPMWHRQHDLSLALVNAAYVRAIEADSAADVIARGMELIETSAGQSPRASAAAARERQAVSTRTAPAIIAGQRRMMRVVDVPIGEAGVAGYAIDVQELEDARADLGLFVRAQHDMFDRLSAGVAQFAGDHSLIFYNRHFLRLFAMEPDWLVDRPDFDRVLERMREAQRAPESRDFPGWKAERRQWFSTTEPIEENWQLPGGMHLRVVAQPLPDRGLLLIFEDRTEHLQLASARDTLLRVRAATFDNLFEAIGVFAADGRLHLWNNRFREVWDLSEDDLALHPRLDTLVQLMAPKLLDPTRSGLIRELVRIATVDRQQRSGRISLVDGRHFEFAAVPLPDGNALFTLLDITASRGIEEVLRDRNEALEETNRVKNAFVASMSYELRVPLTSITGFAELMAGGHAGELSDTAKEYVDAILSAAERLKSLMGDVLDLTQSAAGTLPTESERIRVADFMRAAIEQVREAARNAGLTLAIDIAADGGVILGDRKRLAQSLDHLLRNAITYTPPGGRVLIRSHIVDGMNEIIVSDNGCGIAPEEREGILERFRSATIDIAHNRPVRGFGLPLARQLVEAHGGTLELISEPGQGTSVILRLPQAESANRA